MSKETEVIAFVASKAGISAKVIKPESSFYELGIDGDDAAELIDEFCEQYKVPVDQISLSKYVGPEAGFGIVSRLFNLGKRSERLKHKDLTISDLIKTAEERRWFDIPTSR